MYGYGWNHMKHAMYYHYTIEKNTGRWGVKKLKNKKRVATKRNLSHELRSEQIGNCLYNRSRMRGPWRTNVYITECEGRPNPSPPAVFQTLRFFMLCVSYIPLFTFHARLLMRTSSFESAHFVLHLMALSKPWTNSKTLKHPKTCFCCIDRSRFLMRS